MKRIIVGMLLLALAVLLLVGCSATPIVMTGSSNEVSLPFTVTTDEWIIEWSYIPEHPGYEVFGFFVYPKGETEAFVVAIIPSLPPSRTGGSIYSYAGAGRYYIQVVAGKVSSWEITILPQSYSHEGGGLD